VSQIGFVFVRQAGAPRYEAFFNEILAGLEDALATTASTVIVQGVEDAAEEMQVYRHWHGAGAADAVVLKDLGLSDDRIEQLQGLGIAFAALADVTQTGDFSAVRIDNGQAMRDSLAYLVGLGHRRIARVSGPTDLTHTRIRTEVFHAEARAAGLDGRVLTGDYSPTSGEQATRELLTSARPPSAIVYDNDLMALGGLRVAHELTVAVPDEVSMLAWDDSVGCQLASPPLTALNHDVHEMGVQLGHALLALLSTGETQSAVASQPVIVERGTTGSTTRRATARARRSP